MLGATATVETAYSNNIVAGDIEISPGVFIDGKTGERYILDTGTKNLSFIRTANDLKNLGIRNNKFFLKLYDVGLKGVNPYNPLLTPEMIKRVTLESMRNLWYYLREISRIPDEGGAVGPGAGKPFILNRGNLAAAWCFSHNIDHYLVLPRQIGKTQSTIAFILWCYIFSANTAMLFLNKDASAANENLKRLKDQKDLLPEYLQQKYVYNEEGEKRLAKGDNVTTLMNQYNSNKIYSKASASSMDGAERIGRGATQAIQWMDEFEFTKYIKTIVEAAGPAYNTASENAENNGAPHCRINNMVPCTSNCAA